NGEQLLLILIIPVLLLAAFSLESLVNVGFNTRWARVDFLVPGIIALAIMSTAFTSQAIATGFERRYGVLKRLGATPLSRGVLFPLSRFPLGAQGPLKLLPSGALSDALRSVLRSAGGLPGRDLVVLAVWAVVGIGLAARTFHWE